MLAVCGSAMTMAGSVMWRTTSTKPAQPVSSTPMVRIAPVGNQPNFRLNTYTDPSARKKLGTATPMNASTVRM